MQDVPKIVLKRLQETAAAGPHPDADLLTAFVERALGEGERARVAEHLSRCGDCREVVALATPPAGEVAAVDVLVRPARSGWFGWPVLRWVAMAAAGIVVIASVGIMQYRHGQKSGTLVSNLTARNETSATPEAIPSPPAAVPEMKEALSLAEQQRQAETRKKGPASGTDNLYADRLSAPAHPAMPKAQVMRGVEAGGASRGALGFAKSTGAVVPKAAPLASAGRTDGVDANGNLKNATPAETAKLAPSLSSGQAAAAQTSSQTVVIEGTSQAVTAATDSQVPDQIIENRKEHPSSNESSAPVGVVAPKDAATATGASKMWLASPRWNIGADGALLHSFDAGQTWASVNVNSEPTASESKAARSGSENTYGRNKTRVKAQPNVIFRAVTADGSEVWAGGSAAMLYHSSDAGLHWTRVLPSSSGVTLTGDITSIAFSDAQHVRIVTSAGEIWTSADNGHTWMR